LVCDDLAVPRRLASESDPPLPHAPGVWWFVGGILLMPLAVFMAQATVREAFVVVHRDEYVRDELVIEAMDDDPARLFGQIVSTDEEVTADMSAAGPGNLDRFRQLQQEGRLKGTTIPVLYLPTSAPNWWPGASEARVLEIWDLEDRAKMWRILAAVNVGMGVASALMIRHGFKKSRAPAAND